MIEKHNFHWREGFFYGFPKKRGLFDVLVKEIKTRQIISVIGLRRTGKSTLLKQLIDHLIGSEKVERRDILFYSFDEEQPKIEEIIGEYETITGKGILKAKKGRVHVFLDEVQKLENWQNQIKYYYDNYHDNIKFFVSGSSSLFIKKQATESLAGRIYQHVLEPLSFGEFLIFRGNEELIEKAGLLKEELKREFLAYQKRQFVEIVNESEDRVGEYARTMVEKIVYQDIPKIFPVEYEELLIKMLGIIASNPGMLSDYESISRDLGISRITLSNYFFYLEESFLIRKLYNFSRNALTSEKRMKKFYLATTAFFPFLNAGVDESKLIENLIINAINAKFFWRTPQKYEVDAVLLENGGKAIVPVEIKYRNKIVEKDLKNLLRFCENFNVKKAVLVTKDTEKREEFESNPGKAIKVEFVPAWKFLLEARKGAEK